jgi:hypothetical protein
MNASPEDDKFKRRTTFHLKAGISFSSISS